MRVWHARALALRCGDGVFYRNAGSFHRDVERFMKPPHIIMRADKARLPGTTQGICVCLETKI